MIKILADATLPDLNRLFPQPFALTTYDNFTQVTALLPEHDVLLCRSTLKVTEALLGTSPIQCVATASSGVDHIDTDYLKTKNLVLFDAKGANARAVADYVVSTLAFLRRIKPLTGIKAGVIGVGEVGSRVVSRLKAAGLDVICFDPLKETQDPSQHYSSLEELYVCDVLCVHANWHESHPFPSNRLINADFLKHLKPGVTLINASRGNIVDEDALLKTTAPITYCTDVYSNEPFVNEQIIHFATLCTPHIAGHSIEAKQDAVFLLSQKLHHHYGLTPCTTNSSIGVIHPIVSPGSDWEEVVLSLYNPGIDTTCLKLAKDKKHAFLTRRNAHQFRHDYIIYNTHRMTSLTQQLLGH